MDAINSKAFLSLHLKGFSSPNIPFATFHQGDVDLNFIIDTGSDDNVIDQRILKRLNYDKTDYEGTLAGVGGIQKVEGCTLTFQHEDEFFTTKFLASDSIKEAFDMMQKEYGIQFHGMLGSVFLQQFKIVLDFTTMVAYNRE